MANSRVRSEEPPRATEKRAVSVSVRADLIDEANAFGTNISAILEQALDAEHHRRRSERWRTENSRAVQAWNDWIEENGVPFSELRPW